MERISDYILTENIHESRNSVIYRGHRINENQPVIIKLLKTKKPSPGELARFKQEYNLIKNLNLEKIVKTLDFVEDTFNYAIIEEDFNGISLKKLIKTRKISLQNFLEIAITLSETLSNLHKNNIIHLDIKPDNILINTEENLVKITDFGISAILTHANDEIYNPAVIQGTLAYMSPEQTGRMNRSMDYRTDMYSLGITFYEMLTGELPFKSKDPIELIHSHIARQPTAPQDLNPDIPTVISLIILKLLAKSPEERYQNASGLAFDLTECLNQLTKSDTIKDFPIAEKDISIRFNIPQFLIGREQEFTSLMDAFERTCVVAGEMMLVTGSPGIGKSALVNEIYKPIVAKRGYFISSKYDQFKKDIPYSSIIQAFQNLIRQLIAESEDRVHSWKDKLLSALGSNGNVLISAIPELEYVIGKQPDVPDLQPEESQNRFNLLFQKFVNVFISEEHPLVLFLDDLQWADMASLRLIKLLLTGNMAKHFFFIGAYRDTEIDQSHPLMIMINEIAKYGTTINNITLKPLDIVNINMILVNVLRCKAEQSIELAELVHRKTAGNPFFVNQFLKGLYDKRVLSLDPKDGWTWNINSIMEMQVTDNVVEFMAAKISSLPENTQDILKICSCIGNWFDLESLAAVSEKTMEAVLEDLSSAIGEDLIRLYEGVYKFHHDRIQEAAYSLIPESERAQMHYRIGSNALKKTDPADLNKKIFYIVDQLNRGNRFLINYDERFNLMHLNEQAASKAKNTAAYGAAAGYLEKAKSLLSKEEWSLHSQKLFSLSIKYAECLYFSGNTDNALDLCDQLFEVAANPFDNGAIYLLKTRIMDVTSSQRGAVLDEVRKGLALFGVSLPEDKQEMDKKVKEGIAKMQAYFARNSIEKLVELPQLTDDSNAMVMELLFQAIPSAAQTDFSLFFLIELLMFERAISYGTTAESCKNFVDLGIIQNTFLGDYERGYQLGKAAFALIDKYKADSLKSGVYFVFSSYISCWRSHYQESLNYFDLAYQSGLETGDMLHMSFSCAWKLIHLIYIGRNLDEVRIEGERVINLLVKLQAVSPLMTAKNALFTIRKLQGFSRENEKTEFEKEDHDLIEFLNNSGNTSGQFILGSHYTLVSYLLEDIEAAEKWNAYTESVIQAGYGFIQNADHLLIQSLILIGTWETAEADVKNRIMEVLSTKLAKLKIWSENSPANFLHKYYLLSAELAAIKGDPLEVIINLYTKAIDSIGKDDFIHMKALINERLGVFWLDKMDNKTIGSSFIQKAYQLYDQWGATAKVKILEEKFSDFITPSQKKNSGTSTIDSSTSSLSNTLDINVVIKTYQILSSEIDLGKLLSKIMKLSIESAGAEHGYLILEKEQDKKLYVEVAGKVDREAETLKSIPVEANDSLAVSIVNYVYKTGENIVLGDTKSDRRFINDPYIIKHKPKSLLCAPIRSKGAIAGIIYLENNLTTNAFTPDELEFLQMISTQAAIAIENAVLYKKQRRAEEKLKESLNNLNKVFEYTVSAMSLVIEARDPYTAGHQKRVSDLAVSIARELNLDKDMIIGIQIAGLIHDLGKISIPAEILTKPGRLNDLEFNFIKNHSKCGYEILKPIPFPWPIAEIVHQHHERLNGTGYPLGLSNNEILFESYIIAVADVVEAMASHRPYRPSLGIEISLDEIRKNRGILYNCEVVDACLALFEKGFVLKD